MAKKSKDRADLPLLKFRFHPDGMPLRCSAWSESGSRKDGDVKIYCEVRLDGYVPAQTTSGMDGVDVATVRSYWLVWIRKGLVPRGGKMVPGRNYEATIELRCDREVVIPGLPLLRGRATHWKDAIEEVGEFSNPGSVMQKLGARMYGVRDRWADVRPLRLRWPYSNQEEPNARYGEITRVGGHVFDHESDGTVASCYDGGTAKVAKELTQRYQGNAFLLGPDANGKYHLYHRDYMSKADEIDIGDYRGRLIAGTGDSEF